MKSLEEKEFIEILLEAYNLGAECVKAINTKKGWTENKVKKERASLDRIMKKVGASKLTDEEYSLFND